MSNDLPDMRASHEDRERVVDVLRAAGGDGRLSVEELDIRLERALAAQTLGELAGITADLPTVPAKDVLVVEQGGGRYVQKGHWSVPASIQLRTSMVRVTLDFTRALITSNVLRIDTVMVHGKLFIITTPGMVVNTDGLALVFSKVKVRAKDTTAVPRLHIELAGTLTHAKIIERRR